jgi:CheY-like chemotaxis protein
MKKKIMLIDDSVTIHRVIDLCVDKEKYDVVKVFTKDEAFSHFKEEKPDLILLDNKLGEIPAKDMIASIRGAIGNVFIILLAGAFDQFDSNLCFIVGADDFIYKPFDAKTLDEKIVNGFSGVSQFETIDQSEIPTDEELAAAMSDVPQEMEMMLDETEPLPEELPATAEDVALPEDISVEDEQPAEEEEIQFELPVEEEVHAEVDIPSVVSEPLNDFAHEVPETAVSGGAFDGLIEVDEDQLAAAEELRLEEERLAAELAAEPAPEAEAVIEEAPEEIAVQTSHNPFDGLVEVDEDHLEEKEPEADGETVDALLEEAEADTDELTDDEQENLFNDLEESEGDELDNILDGINDDEGHKEDDTAHVDAALDDAEEALDETVETVLTDIQADLSLSDVMEEHSIDEEQDTPAAEEQPAEEEFEMPELEEPVADEEPEMPEPAPVKAPEVRDIDPEPMVRISEEKLVEAVYEAIDEDTLKFAIKEVLTDKITRILEEELPVLVERAIRKEIERLVKGK